MIEKDKLKSYAEKLMFRMNESEYETLQKEFEVTLKQMELIGKIENISEVEPMIFPFVNEEVDLREDVVKDELETDEALANAKEVLHDQVKVPKVVE